jgi:hypothetical protein
VSQPWIPTGEPSGLLTRIADDGAGPPCSTQRAGGGAALPTSVTSNADKVWVVYLQA